MYIIPTLLFEGCLLETILKMGQGAAPAGWARNPALGRLRGSARAALGPLCKELAGLGQGRQCPTSQEARPGADAEPRGFRWKSRGGAPKGAPAGVIGWRSLAVQGSARPRGGSWVRRFRTSADRRSAPLDFGGRIRTTAYPAPQRIGAAERWLVMKFRTAKFDLQIRSRANHNTRRMASMVSCAAYTNELGRHDPPDLHRSRTLPGAVRRLCGVPVGDAGGG